MKIKSLQLKNFKRFTDVTLQGIPGNAKLVLLIGSNGSGKSSVFDAFEFFSPFFKQESSSSARQFIDINNYYRKDIKVSTMVEILFSDGVHIHRLLDTSNNSGGSNSSINRDNIFYGRTGFRQIPMLKKKSLGNQHNFRIERDTDRPAVFIERDERFENDLEHIFGILLKEFFRTTDNKSEIKEKVVNPINAAFENIFSKESGTALRLLELIPPLEGKTAEVNFKKGNSTFHYNYLSAGEKEVFNILINLIARKEYYQDTIYFFDEIDLHLNTKLQYNFLKEITENWIPENCQLWTASHSLGFIQYAKESENAVVFDLDDYDFDYPKVLSPEPKDSADIYEIAISKEILPSLFKNYKIFFVENKDRLVYSELNITNALFVQENGKTGVYHKVKNGEFFGIVDRDFLTDNDIVEIEKQYATLKVLRYYSIENYLFHPDNLVEYYAGLSLPFDVEGYIEKLLQAKNDVSDELIRKLALVRISYPFFREPEFQNSKNQKRFASATENLEEVADVEKLLKSNNFADFYKVFPMKDYATHLPERQNLSKIELAKTTWFKIQIENLIK